MKRFVRSVIAAATVIALGTGTAMASEAYLVDSTDLYAGPDVDYPQIGPLPAGVAVNVYGCTSGWEWCDVQAGGDRGWVSGEFLQYEYQNQRVFVPAYGAQIGIPIVAFALGAYWESHYRSRPWYGQRDDWSHRRFASRPAPRPQHVDNHNHNDGPHPQPGHGPARPPQPVHDNNGGHDDHGHPPGVVGHPVANPPPNTRTVVQHAPPKPRPTPGVQPGNVQHPANANANANVQHARPMPQNAQRSPVPPKNQPAPKRETPPQHDGDKKDDGHR